MPTRVETRSIEHFPRVLFRWSSIKPALLFLISQANHTHTGHVLLANIMGPIAITTNQNNKHSIKKDPFFRHSKKTPPLIRQATQLKSVKQQQNTQFMKDTLLMFNSQHTIILGFIAFGNGIVIFCYVSLPYIKQTIVSCRISSLLVRVRVLHPPPSTKEIQGLRRNFTQKSEDIPHKTMVCLIYGKET